MSKRFVAFIIAFTVFNAVNAQPVSTQAALKKAQRFMPQKDFLTIHCKRVNGFSDTASSSLYYVFNDKRNGGFVIVSGDERTEEILGYSDTGYFDPEDLPVNVRWWLNSYIKSLEFLQRQDMGNIVRKTEVGGKEAIAPLLKTQWGQGSPFNNRCPSLNEERCVTGCVATAIAQLMRYYGYPASSKATYTYRTKTHRILMKALPATNFDWENISYEYNQDSPEVAKEAVATLLLYCGCALSMDYSLDGSGADSTPVCDAMEYFFDYDEDIKKVYRGDYTAQAWEDIIYNELAKAYPVYYSGRNADSGHAFVCDGYDNGFFHINWGWNGWYDGYFKLSILYPFAGNYDETPNEEGYGQDQMAVINIVPRDFQGFETKVNNLVISSKSTYYDLQGLRQSKPHRGINIIRTHDGKTHKVLVK